MLLKDKAFRTCHTPCLTQQKKTAHERFHVSLIKDRLLADAAYPSMMYRGLIEAPLNEN